MLRAAPQPRPLARPALVLLACVLAGSAAGQREAGARAYHRSDALGIARCSLPGVLGGEDVTLHLWLRMVPPEVASRSLCSRPDAHEQCSRTAVVRGFAFLQSSRRSVPYYNKAGIQLLQASSIKHFSRLVFLRSTLTGALYPIRTLMSFAQNPAMNTSSSTSGGTLGPFVPLGTELNNTSSVTALSDAAASAVAALSNPNVTLVDQEDAACTSNPHVRGPRCSNQGFTSHVMDLVGHVQLNGTDLNMQDFEVRVIGFDWHCPFLVEPPVLGVPTSPTLEAPASSTWPGWTFHTASTFSSSTQVWQVLAPYHGMDIQQYATLLWHRVLWHAQLGIHKYLLYVYESLSPLMKEPLIQELMRQGYLHVVFFAEMPKHEERVLQPTLTDVYINQVVAYNHALLALWGSDSLVLVADIDEYIVTPKPTTMVQVFQQCRNLTSAPRARRRPLAGLQMRRSDATCAPGVSEQRCSTTSPGLPAWTSVHPSDVLSGRAEHPLSWHALTEGRDMWLVHNTKMFVDPNLSRDYHVHFFRPLRGAIRDWANTSCVRVLHLVDLYRVRPGVLLLSRPGLANMTGAEHVRGSAVSALSSWWWPREALLAAGQMRSKAS